MSLVDGASYDEDVLESMNLWTDQVHSEIQDSGVLDYGSTKVEPLDADYRRQIGEYLSENFGLGYTAVMFFLDGTKATYCVENDVLLMCYDLLNSEFGDEAREILAHEQGHRLGHMIIDQRLEPLQSSQDVSSKEFGMLESYLISENFAERTKVAVGNTLGKDFSYRVELMEDTPRLYGITGRIGPEELVDSDRDEELQDLVIDVENMLGELENCEVS